jgi:hypothetical protein
MEYATYDTLKVRPVTGPEEIIRDVPTDITVRDFKQLIANQINVKPECQKLMLLGKVLEDGACSVDREASVVLGFV